jgi:N-acyl-D-aspartate/D-glutamate deacylase
MLDLKISGGTIIDGTGAARYRGDVGVRDGLIVALGKVDEPAREEIDAAGRIVAPGFVDPHTHYDAQAFWDPTLSPSCYHGVTTIFGGFCGFSIAPLSKESGAYLMPMLARVEGMPLESLAAGVPWDWSSFAEYLSRLDGKLAINAGFLAGHSTIRRYVMGPRAVGEQATPEELDAMTDLLRDSIRGGALGFSTTLSVTHCDAEGKPVPSRHASREEVYALASVLSEFEGTSMEMIPAVDFTEDTYEVLTRCSLAAQRPVNWNALALLSLAPDQKARRDMQLGATDYARARGAEVIALTIPQTPTIRLNMLSGFVFDCLPGWESFFRQSVEARIETLKDPAGRARLKAGAASENGGMKFIAQWESMKIAEVFTPENKPYEGRLIGEIAAEETRDPFDVFVEVTIADGLRTSFMPQLPPEDLELFRERAKIWLDDRTVIGASDAGAHLDMIDTFGAPTALLELGVRRYGVFSLEQAVHQLTAKPAELFGLRERGELREGWHADIVIFDPDKIAQGEVHTRDDLPGGCGRLYAEAHGIHNVIVNGREIIRDGVYLGTPAGVIIRPGLDTYTVGIPGAREQIAAE